MGTIARSAVPTIVFSSARRISAGVRAGAPTKFTDRVTAGSANPRRLVDAGTPSTRPSQSPQAKGMTDPTFADAPSRPNVRRYPVVTVWIRPAASSIGRAWSKKMLPSEYAYPTSAKLSPIGAGESARGSRSCARASGTSIETTSAMVTGAARRAPELEIHCAGAMIVPVR
jgi:hypothetical protein